MEHEHEHEHSHTYTHSHPHEHDHDHEHEHHHDHEHHHEHDHEHEHHHHDHEHHHHHDHDGAAPADQLHALMNYMVIHNADHTAELEHLAEHIKEAGNDKAYDLAMEAARLYTQGTEVLKKALEALDK